MLIATRVTGSRPSFRSRGSGRRPASVECQCPSRLTRSPPRSRRLLTWVFRSSDSEHFEPSEASSTMSSCLAPTTGRHLCGRHSRTHSDVVVIKSAADRIRSITSVLFSTLIGTAVAVASPSQLRFSCRSTSARSSLKSESIIATRVLRSSSSPMLPCKPGLQEWVAALRAIGDENRPFRHRYQWPSSTRRQRVRGRRPRLLP